jgi:preprotein translocase subunit SecG
MEFILSAIVLLSSVLLILVVYIQNPKGGGLSSDFASPGQLGGVKKTNEFIDRLTWSLAGIIVLVSIVITIRQPKPNRNDENQKSTTEQSVPQNPGSSN